jgi:hypothetical protein
MINPIERRFRLGLTIQDNPEFDGLHAAIALVHEEGKDTPLLNIMAGGVPANNEGAGMLADALRDAAEAIDEYLGREREHTMTDTLPTIKVPTSDEPEPKPRPRFNPRPAGPSKQ